MLSTEQNMIRKRWKTKSR